MSVSGIHSEDRGTQIFSGWCFDAPGFYQAPFPWLPSSGTWILKFKAFLICMFEFIGRKWITNKYLVHTLIIIDSPTVYKVSQHTLHAKSQYFYFLYSLLGLCVAELFLVALTLFSYYGFCLSFQVCLSYRDATRPSCWIPTSWPRTPKWYRQEILESESWTRSTT